MLEIEDDYFYIDKMIGKLRLLAKQNMNLIKGDNLGQLILDCEELSNRSLK